MFCSILFLFFQGKKDLFSVAFFFFCHQVLATKFYQASEVNFIPDNIHHFYYHHYYHHHHNQRPFNIHMKNSSPEQEIVKGCFVNHTLSTTKNLGQNLIGKCMGDSQRWKDDGRMASKHLKHTVVRFPVSLFVSKYIHNMLGPEEVCNMEMPIGPHPKTIPRTCSL